MNSLGDQIREMHKTMTYSQISKALGVGKSLISYHVNPDVRKNNATKSREARRARAARLDAIKAAQPCADCGESYEGYLMDFDQAEVVCCMCYRIRKHVELQG